MAVIFLDPDPRSTIEASDEYKAAWFAAYGDGDPSEPPPPPSGPIPFTIDERVLPEYLQRAGIGAYIDAEVAEGLEDFNPMVVEEFHFVIASDTWVCDHTIGRRLVDVVTVNGNGTEIIGDVKFENENRVVIRWARPQTGTVRLST